MMKHSTKVNPGHPLLVLVIIICLSACTVNPATIQNTAKATDREPVTYAGEIPCADCAGQRIVLTLFPDFMFRLRQTCLDVSNGQDKDFYDLGRWVVENGSDRLKLYGAAEKLWQFRFQEADRLRMFDTEGNELFSDLNYELTRQPDIDLVEGPMLLCGMYMYMADSAVFKECLTEKSYPVLIEADHLALERAYLSMRRRPGEPILVSFKGRFVQRMPEPGLPVREHLIVEQFDRVLPGQTCMAITEETSLLETHWYPVEIGGKIVAIKSNQREPYFVLSAKDNRVSGFSGCNRLIGGFELRSEFFRFTGMAATKMACLSPAMELEMAFFRTLNTVNSYRIAGNTLELKDVDEVVRMRLEAK